MNERVPTREEAAKAMLRFCDMGNGVLAQAPAEAKYPGVENRLQETFERVGVLHERISALNDALRPILIERPMESVGDTEEKQPPQSEIGTALMQLNNELRSAADRLGRLQRQLDL